MMLGGRLKSDDIGPHIRHSEPMRNRAPQNAALFQQPLIIGARRAFSRDDQNNGITHSMRADDKAAQRLMRFVLPFTV